MEFGISSFAGFASMLLYELVKQEDTSTRFDRSYKEDAKKGGRLSIVPDFQPYIGLLLIVLFAIGSFTGDKHLSTNRGVQNSNLVALGSLENHENVLQEETTRIEKDLAYQGSLPPNGSKGYLVNAAEKSILVLFITTDAQKTSLDVDLNGSLKKVYGDVPHLWDSHFYYVETEGEVHIAFSNSQSNTTVYYEFFVDISERLQTCNTKVIPLEGGIVAFHTDLNRDDQLTLSLNSSVNHQLRQRVYTLCLEWVKLKFRGFTLCTYSKYAEPSSGTMSLTADDRGRYYIILRSVEGSGPFSLSSAINSPPWSQEWFWPIVWFGFVAVLSFYFVSKIRRFRRSDKPGTIILYSVTSGYCSLIAVGLFYHLVGAFHYGTWKSAFPFLHLWTLFLGSSLMTRVYASYLDRKITAGVCPYCGREVNLRTDNYCCDGRVKQVSNGWYLAPAYFSFLFFLVGNFVSTGFSESLWLAASGSLIGGIVAWWMAASRGTYERKAWSLLAAGIACSFTVPWLIREMIVQEVMFQPHREVWWPGELLCIRVAESSLSGFVVLLSILAGVSALVVLLETRHRVTSP